MTSPLWPLTAHGSSPIVYSCGFAVHHPGAPFWTANVRTMAHAARRGLRALAKVGQAGWKSFAQELLPPPLLHRWVLSAYASFLLSVDQLNGSIALGGGGRARTRAAARRHVPALTRLSSTRTAAVHPFGKQPSGRVVPWIHPALRLDIGAPVHSEAPIERYRPPGHTTYVRRFERAVAAYNPEDAADRGVPLGGEYVDPWGADCTPTATIDVAPREGVLMVDPALLLAGAAAPRQHASGKRGGGARGGARGGRGGARGRSSKRELGERLRLH